MKHRLSDNENNIKDNAVSINKILQVSTCDKKWGINYFKLRKMKVRVMYDKITLCSQNWLVKRS